MTDILVSYPYISPKVLEALQDCRVILDSGAFTVHKTGKEIKLQDYINFIQENKGKFWEYIALDVIGDFKKTDENFREMKKQGLCPLPVLDYRRDYKDFLAWQNDTDYLCIGGMAGKGNTLEVETKLRYLKNKGVNFRYFHFLGVGFLPCIEEFKPFSFDSSTWLWADVFHRKIIFNYGKIKRTDLKSQKSNLDLFESVKKYFKDKYLSIYFYSIGGLSDIRRLQKAEIIKN